MASDTTLTGGAITSTDKAVHESRNSFSTGGALTTTDIQNRAQYQGEGFSLSASYTAEHKDAAGQPVKAKPGGAAGIGSESDSANSTTSAGISGIAGNTAVRSTDPQSGIAPIFDKDRVKDSIGAQLAITAEFGKQASKAIGDYAAGQMKQAAALREQAKAEADPEKRTALNAQADQLQADWGDTGTLRLLAHTVVGGLTGGGGGAAGAAAGTLSAPAIANSLKEAGVEGALASAITGIGSTLIGGAVGGAVGGAAALNEVANNYLKHAELTLKGQQLVDCKTDKCRADIQAYWNKVSQDRNSQMESSCIDRGTAQCRANVSEMQQDLKDLQAAAGDLSKGTSGFTAEERNNIKQVMAQTRGNLETLADLGNKQLGTTYSSPDALVAAGILTGQEGELLKAARADSMVNFLGAIYLPAGTKANPVRSATKTSDAEFVPPVGKAGQASKADGDFKTLGLNDVDPMRLLDGVKMVRELEKAGYSYDDAIRAARSYVSSGSTSPVAISLDITDKLVKVVPAGGAPSSGTGYWMTESEFSLLRTNPSAIASKLGLPPGMHADAFDVFQITPRSGALVFESTIAPTTVDGQFSTTGGGKANYRGR